MLLLNLNAKSVDFTSIQQYVEEKKLAVQTQSLGGHSGYCIAMKLSNKSSEMLNVWIEPGRRLTSIDSIKQDIFIVKEIKLQLLPGENKSIEVYGFCCQSSLSSPAQGDEFNLGYMAAETWLALADYINEQNLVSHEIQMAVWVFSNNHHPASICGSDDPQVKALREKVAEIRKETGPWYCIQYEPDELLLFSNRHESFSGRFDFNVRHYSTLTIQIRTQKGRLIKTLAQDAIYNEGEYTFQVNQDVKGWAKGNYQIIVLEDNSNLIRKTEFSL